MNSHEAISATTDTAMCRVRAMPDRSLSCCIITTMAATQARVATSISKNSTTLGSSCACARSRVRLASKRSHSHQARAR